MTVLSLFRRIGNGLLVVGLKSDNLGNPIFLPVATLRQTPELVMDRIFPHCTQVFPKSSAQFHESFGAVVHRVRLQLISIR